MKAQIHFNWIFIMIAGAIIIIFFASFAVKYKDLQQEKTEIIFLNNLDNTLTKLQASPFSTTAEIEIPMETTINCNSLSINNQVFIDYILFGPEKIKGDVIVWYYPFEFPYKITNFYFIIPKNQDYEIEYNSETENIVNNILEQTPSNLQNQIRKTPTTNSEKYKCRKDKIEEEIIRVTDIYIKKVQTIKNSNCNYNLITNKLNQFKQSPWNPQIADEIEEYNHDLAQQGCPTLF
ncbi:hypothetical protein K8R47_03295 [archaeon]|nr:hypothetical protein [archaeon]